MQVIQEHSRLRVDARVAKTRLSALRDECGCGWGMVGMVACFSVAVGWLAIRHGLFTSAFFWRLPWAFLCACAGMGVGKWLGVRRRRESLRRAIARVFRSILEH
jgi:hypothetical protein